MSHSDEAVAIWILGEPGDVEVLWLTTLLQQSGMRVEFVLPEEIIIGSSFSYRVDGVGTVSLLRLHDGRIISDDTTGLIINRLRNIPLIGGNISPLDASYLAAEWHAAIVAWFHTFRCPVLNSPRAGVESLAGSTMLPLAWRTLAHAFGLAAQPWRSTETEDVTNTINIVCLGARCFSRSYVVPPDIVTSLTKMARFVGSPLFGATFIRNESKWIFLEATSYPRLAEVGEQIVDAIIDYATVQRSPI